MSDKDVDMITLLRAELSELTKTLNSSTDENEKSFVRNLILRKEDQMLEMLKQRRKASSGEDTICYQNLHSVFMLMMVYNFVFELSDALNATPHLIQLLKSRLLVMKEYQVPVVLSPSGGMQGQPTGPFGRKLYGVTDVATAVAQLADKTFANFAQHKVEPNKTHYTMGALLSGMGTGKSAFLDHHVSLLCENCKNEALQELLTPNRRPLVLNLTLNSSTGYTAAEGAADSGSISIARRLVYAYTREDWDVIQAAKVDGIFSPRAVLDLIAHHHRTVCAMPDDQPMVVVVNVDEVNQVHTQLQKTAADLRVREMVVALRQLSMHGTTGARGVGSAVMCLLAGTGSVDFRDAMKGSGVEYVTHRLPLLNNAEVLSLMKECGVSDAYLSNPSFLQLLEDTGGVPRVLRKVVEGLTPQFAESSITQARRNAVEYVVGSNTNLNLQERAALVPYVVLGATAPPMTTPLVPQSPANRTFEDLSMNGAIFEEGGKLLMPVLLLEALFPTKGTTDPAFVARLIHWYHQRSWDGFEMFCALFHAAKMQHLREQPQQEVSLEKFYDGALMPPSVASLTIKLEKGAAYEVVGNPSDTKTYQFPGRDDTRNKASVARLIEGAILLNGKRAPAGDCLLTNPLGADKPGVLVRSLCVSHTVGDLKLDEKKILDDHNKAKEAFKEHSDLFAEWGGAEVVTVHLSNRELNEDAKTPRDGCVVIGRDQVRSFFGPTFHRGLLSPGSAAALWSRTSVRAHSTAASHMGGSRLKGPPHSPFPRSVPAPAPALPSHSAAGLRLVRSLVRRLL